MDPITVSGNSFTNPAGLRLTYCGFTEFRLLDHFLNGRDIIPVLEDRKAVMAEVKAQAAHTGDGAWIFPVLRVFGMMENITKLHPQDWPTYYTSIRALADFAATYGFYVKYDVFADAQIVMSSQVDQWNHWNKFAWALNGCETVLVSLGNEAPKNGFDPSKFNKLGAYPVARGSQLGDANPYLPAWDFSEYHGRRDGVKGLLSSTDLAWAIDGYPGEGSNPGWPGTQQATIHDEPLGAADVSVSGRRSQYPRVFYALGACAALFGSGGTFHSDCGIQSIPFTPIQRSCAEAFVMGLSKMDPAQRFEHGL